MQIYDLGIMERIQRVERAECERRIERRRQVREAMAIGRERQGGNGEVREAVGGMMIRVGAWVAGQAIDEVIRPSGRIPSAG